VTGATVSPGPAALWRALALVVWLPACAPVALSPEERAADAAWEARRGALAALDHWQAVGRLSLQSGERAWHASLVWEEEGDAYRIRLLGPLGQGAVEIRGGADQVTLRTARGETYTASDPETLMAEALGWGVPLRGLRHWLLGRDDPDGGSARPSLDAEGRPLALRQDGWEVQYLAYLPAEPVSLPGRLQLDREDLHARVVISRWDLGPR
jgi:outer membrane lipoprotein LolB